MSQKLWTEASGAIQLTHGAALGGYLGYVIATGDQSASKAAGLSLTLVLITFFVISVSAFGNRFHDGRYGISLVYLMFSVGWMKVIMYPAALLGANNMVLYGICVSWIISTAFEHCSSLGAMLMTKIREMRNN